MYPWATREYILWCMSLGMLVFYYNEGINQKYPKPEKETKSLANMSPEQVSKIREEIRELYGEVG